MKKDKKLNSTQVILILGFSIVLIAVLIIGGVIIMKINKPAEEQTGTGNYVFDESNVDNVNSQIASEVADGMFEMSMNTVWNFKDGTSASSDAYVANSIMNKYDFAFEVQLTEEDRIIYTSTIVPVGKKINEIVLEEALQKGNYDARCIYHLLDTDGNEKSSLTVNIKINVEN